MIFYSDYGFNDSPPQSAAYLYNRVLSLLGNNNSMILDLGCGNGWLTRAMLKNGYDAYGIDASPSGISVGKKYNPNRFFLHDVRNKELPKEIANVKFDTIISLEVIEHLYDPLDYLEFCSTLLEKSKGKELIISTPYHGFYKNLCISLTNGWDRHFMALEKGEHIKFCSRDTLTDALEKVGFEVIHFSGVGRFPYLWKSMILKAKLTF